jgi:hypothetical protein
MSKPQKLGGLDQCRAVEPHTNGRGGRGLSNTISQNVFLKGFIQYNID